MQNTISDMAQYIKNAIPPNIPEEYTVKAMFQPISNEKNIRNGIVAFRDLLYLICDSLIADGSEYEKPAKSTQEKDAHQSLAGSFPFLNNVKSILFHMGYHGQLNQDEGVILLDDINLISCLVSGDGWPMRSKISTPKLIAALQFMTECGFYFDGIDLDTRKLDISKDAPLKISYPDNPIMLTGLKAMAIAQKELHTKDNHDIFLRCDYRVLKEEKTEASSILKDFLAPFSASIQDFASNLHQRSLDAGLTCVVNIFYLNIRFIYFYKNKEIWTFSTTLDSGYRMLIKAQNTHLYPDVIETFPLQLQEKISRGYGCNKKLFGEPCQSGCHGFSFPLDDSTIHISKHIEAWLDEEISCSQKKKR